MSDSSLIAELKTLSIPERIVLVQELWDSIAEEQPAVGLTEAQKAELQRRVDTYKNSPDAGIYWEDLVARLLEQ